MAQARRSIVPVLVAVIIAVVYTVAMFGLAAFVAAFGFWGDPDDARKLRPRFEEFLNQIKIAVPAFDIVLVVGTWVRWRYVVPASGLLLLIGFVILYRF